MRLLVLSLAALPVLAHGQASLQQLVQRRLEITKSPGAVVAIVRDGKPESIFGIGLSDVENQVPMKPQSVFEIGSLTKQFTATLTMMLVDRGEIALDDSVRKHMPDLPEAWQEVTIRHLLNHTSGIPSYTRFTGFGVLASMPASHSQFVKMVAEQKADFPPGEGYLYNNSGYYLLGMLIERLTKKPFRDALKTMILEPLDMRNTDMYLRSEIVPHRVRGYVITPSGLKNTENRDLGWPFAAGGLLSTAEDMVKWEAAQGSTQLLKTSSWEQMWQPTTLKNGRKIQYGFGWSLQKVPGSTVIEHNGAVLGFNAQITRYPDKKLAIIVLTNTMTGNSEAIAEDIAVAIDPTLKPAPPAAIADPTPDLTKRLRAIFEQIVAGNASPDDFEPGFRDQLFPEGVAALSKDLKPLGSIAAFQLSSAGSTDGLTTRIYSATIGERKLTVNFALTPTGKIAGLLIRPQA